MAQGENGIENDAAARNSENQAAIADAIKQFVLLIISLGFSVAFGVLVKGESGDVLRHLSCARDDSACQLFEPGSVSIFATYILIGTRFLLVNWLYLSATYGSNSRKDLIMGPDALGISLTVVLIGIQSYYVGSKENFDFFVWFAIILGVDVFFSGVSVIAHLSTSRSTDLLSDLLWIANNFVCGLGICYVLKRPGSLDDGLLIFIASLNCLMSFAISYFGFFRTSRGAVALTSHRRNL